MWDCEFACGDGLVLGEEQTCCSAWEVLLLVLFTDLVESFQEECDDGGLEAFDGCDASCKAQQFALQGRHPQPIQLCRGGTWIRVRWSREGCAIHDRASATK